jgi:hypothetical protein
MAKLPGVKGFDYKRIAQELGVAETSGESEINSTLEDFQTAREQMFLLQEQGGDPGELDAFKEAAKALYRELLQQFNGDVQAVEELINQ